jgi:peptidoglycan hydrolase-like protein with peptidoglycan-binding domain
MNKRTILSTLAGVGLAVAGALVALRLADAETVVAAGPPPSTSTTSTSTSSTCSSTTTSTTVAHATTLRRGDSGAAVVELQRRLRSLGYWLGAVDGSYGLTVEQAVMAFQKVEGLAVDGVAGPGTQEALASAGRPSTSAQGDLVEIDKGGQVLFVVRDGEVAWTLNVSTGTERPYVLDGRTELADTPEGRFKVSWAVDGVDVGALGALYRPRYFHPDGIAVHGYSSVPAYPASHGCVRVSEAAMDWIWSNDLMPIGSAVVVR